MWTMDLGKKTTTMHEKTPATKWTGERKRKTFTHYHRHRHRHRTEMKASSINRTLAIKVLFAVCGVSVFARSESVLLQTSMFSKCFELGDVFYPLASCTLFVPGVLVQIIQVVYGTRIDAAYGTEKATMWRLTTAVLGSTVVLTALIVASFYYMELSGNAAFIFTLLVFLGLGISISFGSFVQIVSLFPAHLHPYFFIGSYSPFFIFAPVNAAIGDLCVKNIDGEWVTRWNSVLVYYILAIVLTMAGLLCFFGVMKHPLGRYLMELKDLQLQMAATTIRIDEDDIGDEENDHISALQRTQQQHQRQRSIQYSTSSRFSEDVEELIDDEEEVEDNGHTERDTLLNANSNSDNGSLSTVAIVLKCLGIVLSQLVTTIASSLVASLYIKVHPTRFDDLPTLLIYDYYICGAIGIFLTAFVFVRRLFTQKRLLVISLIRLIVIPLMLSYTANKLPQNDIVLLVLNSVQMIIAGVVFSLSFSMAANVFHSKPLCARASSIVNFTYYLAMAIGLAISLAIV
eukprot:m.118668 g.118668  ORF g.118668 m.118668 type:complete len:515 (-) comp12899_c0_seq11:235-1779(-)